MEEEEETVKDISLKTWHVMENNLKKEGYREGVAAGKEFMFQSSFDSGYCEGFQIGYAQGILKGLLSILDEEKRNESMSEVEKDLSTTLCMLCEEDIRLKWEKNGKEFIQILKEKNETSISSLKNKYSEVFRTLGINSQVICCIK